MGWVLFLLFTTQYFLRADTVCTIHYAVFSGDGYYLYYSLRSIFWCWIQFVLLTTQYFRGGILFVLFTTQNFRGVDTIYTVHYDIFSWDENYFYYLLRSISLGLDTIYTIQYAVFSGGGY